MAGSPKKPTRLGQWDGARPSTPGLWRQLRPLLSRAVLARLGVLLLIVLSFTALAMSWGPPFPYRTGEISAYDVRARVPFDNLDAGRTQDAIDAALKRLPLPQRNDPVAREWVRRNTPAVIEHYERDTILVQRKQAITEDQRHLLMVEARAYQKAAGLKGQVQRACALFLLMGNLTLLVGLYAVRFQPQVAQSTAHIARIGLLLLLTHLLWLLLARPPWHGGLVPLTATALILSLAYKPQFALLLSFTYSIAITASRGNGLDHLLVQIAGQSTAILLTKNIRSRMQLLEVSAAAGLGYLTMTFATSLLSEQTWPMILSDAVRRFSWGLMAGFLVTGCLPLIERWFGIVSNIRLLELADGSHPLLQELVRRAPGTYNHSQSVAQLSEQAAETIGADALLTRVGAYFHDVGKMLKPTYFIENQNGQNLHDTLEPGLSTLIIIGHVKDGVALAEKYNLPRPVIDFIQQHHGTTLVEYFYRAALRQQEENGHTSRQEGGPCALEASFRYPGPKPQQKETAIVMLSDAVESASRALTDPTPSSLRKLVRDLLMKRLLDGQFEESGLTLTELHAIEESLCKGLISLYHSRIKYPTDPRDKQRVA